MELNKKREAELARLKAELEELNIAHEGTLAGKTFAYFIFKTLSEIKPMKYLFNNLIGRNSSMFTP